MSFFMQMNDYSEEYRNAFLSVVKTLTKLTVVNVHKNCIIFQDVL